MIIKQVYALQFNLTMLGPKTDLLLGQSVNSSFLRPYPEPLGSTFSNGANFAVVGSSTLPRNILFALNVQVLQFLHFKARSLELVAAGSGHLLDDQAFRNALYVIDIGQTDVSDSFAKNMPYEQVVLKIPSVVSQIKNAIQVIYNGGGRRFWVHNTGPFGCLPQRLTMVEKTSENLDRYGCISSYNAAARVFNEILR
ncbi:unnamed protein product [Ilex paraguariensis]|uniref:GDSL esterase/lipase n=1 Tax=Ilex paraguariensis TaxID=185542 RepID=A0ABC8R0K0_9AQUA